MISRFKSPEARAHWRDAMTARAAGQYRNAERYKRAAYRAERGHRRAEQ